MNIVKNKLLLPKNWTPKKIIKLIVTNVKLGGNRRLNDCFVIDESTLTNFFLRTGPSIITNNKQIPIPNYNYEGEITAQKLLNICADPPNIKLVSKQCDWVDAMTQIGKYVCCFRNYQRITPNKVYIPPTE